MKSDEGQQSDSSASKDRRGLNNMEVISGADAVDLSADEIAKRVTQSVTHQTEGLTAKARARASVQHRYDRESLDIPLQKNEISAVADRNRSPGTDDQPLLPSSRKPQAQPDIPAPAGLMEVESHDLALRIGTALRKRYLESGEAFHFRSGRSDIAFTHTDMKIESPHSKADVVRDMVALSVAKGWTDIRLKGTEEFKREAWLEASMYGLKVEGFKPRDVDHLRLNELQSEDARKGFAHATQPRSEMQNLNPQRKQELGDTSVVSFGSDKVRDVNLEQESKPSKTESSVISELQHLMRARGDSEAAIAMASTVAAERFERHHNVLVGTLKDHGAARYHNDSDEKPSYYVTVETRGGEITLWGVDLARAMLKGNIKAGQVIALENSSKRPVTVEESVRDEYGTVIGSRLITSHRNTWEVTALDHSMRGIKEQSAVLEQRHDLKPALPLIDTEPHLSRDRQQHLSTPPERE